MATTTEQPRSSTRPQAMPISPEQLQREIAKPAQPPVQKEPPKEIAKALEPEPVKNDAPEKTADEPAKPSPSLASIGDAVEKKMAEKKAATEAKKSEDKPVKAEAIKAGDAATKTGDAPAKTATEAAAAQDDLTPEERDIMPHDSERVRKRINFHKRENATLVAERDKIKSELDAAKKLPQTAANVEEVEKLKQEHQKVQDELIRYRRLHDVQNDPEFKSKYHEPVAKIEESIEGIFKKYKLDDGTLKTIKDSGGFAAFSESAKLYPIVEADPDDPTQTKTVHKTGGQLLHGWLNSGAINPVDAEAIKASLGKQALLKMEGKAAMDRAQEDAKAHFDNMTAAQRKAAEEAQASVKKHETEYAEWANKTQAETPWLKDAEIPDNASEEEKKSLTERNALNKELREGLKKHPTNAAEYGQLKLEAAESKYLRRTVADKDAEIARLTEQIKSSKAAAKTTSKGGSLLVTGGHKPKEATKQIDPTNPLAGFDEKMKSLSAGGDE